MVPASKKITESESRYNNLENMPVQDLLININKEDQSVAFSVRETIPQIVKLVDGIFPRMQSGGRLFYIGAGTSGRLGIVDASECPPTFGVPPDRVVGIIAGGDSAIRKAVEFAEDDKNGGWHDLQKFNINNTDSVIGIAASGYTPYVTGAIQKCNEAGIFTGCITCNPDSELALLASCPVTVVTGPEFVTGSTRMKAGTAQKLILNMISTSLMIKLGHVKGNKMVDMQLTNNKLIERGTQMVMSELKVDETRARELLLKYGNARNAIQNGK